MSFKIPIKFCSFWSFSWYPRARYFNSLHQWSKIHFQSSRTRTTTYALRTQKQIYWKEISHIHVYM